MTEPNTPDFDGESYGGDDAGAEAEQNPAFHDQPAEDLPAAAMTTTPQAAELPNAYVPEELRDAIVTCLGDDAASLRDENPEDERADNMDQAADLIEVLRKDLASALAAHAVGVPAGFAIMPKVATEEMVNEAQLRANVTGLDDQAVCEIWDAMVEVAPAAPAPQVDAGELLEILEEAMSMLGTRLIKDTFGYEWHEKATAAISRAEAALKGQAQ